MKMEVVKRRFLDLVIVFGLLTIIVYRLFIDKAFAIIACTSIVSVYIELWHIVAQVTKLDNIKKSIIRKVCGWFVLITICFAVLLALIVLNAISINSKTADVLSLAALLICLPSDFYVAILSTLFSK